MGLFYTIAVGVVAYLIGSINSSILISKAVMGKDIRESGSGNAGATNMLRTMGKKYAIITLVIDILKGVVALLLAMLAIKFGAYAVSMYIAGVAVVVGHNFPVFFGFKGGKGVATSLGVILLLDWKIGLITLVIALAIMAVSKYVSLASMCMMVGFFVEFVVFTELDMLKPIAGSEYTIETYILVFFMAALAVFKHRSNIVRLVNGTERKIGQKKEGQVG